MTIEPTNMAEFAHLDGFYRLLVKNLPSMALLVFDKNMRYVLAEGAFLQTAGYVPSEILGKSLEEVVPQSRYADLLSHYQSALAGNVVEFEGSTGQLFYRSRISPIKDDQGEVVAGMIVTEDITAQKHAEHTLQESEARYRALAENSSDLILQINPDGECVYASSSAQRIIGYPPMEMLGKTIIEFAHPDDANRVNTNRLQAVQQPTPLETITVRFRHKQGHYVWLERTGLPIFSGTNPQLIGFVLTCRDVTERHNAEESLRESEDRLRLLLENSVDGIMLGERSKIGKILLANPAACRLFERSEAELLAAHGSDLFDINDPRFIAFTKQRKYLSAGRTELIGLRKDGTPFPIDLTVSDFTSRDGQLLTWRIVRDMSDRQRYLQLRIEQEKLLVALQKESELSRLKSRMMERVAHEFRTPLTTINVTLALLTSYLDRLTPEQRQQKAELVHRQTGRLTDLLAEIDLAINGNLVPENLLIAPLDLKELCQRIIRELEEQFARPGIVMMDSPHSLVINGDPAVLKTALHHVMHNALRFSAPTAQVKLTISVRSQGAELQVSDTGLGIPPKDQARIFEPFYRGSNIGEISGLGLGLTIAQASILAHHGTIKLDSKQGEGTIVTIWLPHSPFDDRPLN